MPFYVPLRSDAPFSPFWQTVDRLREERNMSLEKLALRASLSRSCLQKRRERESGYERLIDCVRLFEVLGCDTSLYVAPRKPLAESEPTAANWFSDRVLKELA